MAEAQAGTLRYELPRLAGPLKFLLFSSFLIPMGSFMVLPFMSVFLHERLGMSLGVVGVVLAVASLVQFSGGVVGGAVADRIGLRATMVLALIVRTTGFAGFLIALRWPLVSVAALILTCCGAALYLPANKAYFVHGVPVDRRALFLSVSNAALHAGMAVGPVVAGPFVLSAPGALFVVVTALFLVVTTGHVLLPERHGTRELVDGPAAAGPASVRGLLGGIHPPTFAATVIAFYSYFHFQHFLAVFAVDQASTEFYSLVLLTCFLLVIVVQPLGSGWIGRLSYLRALVVGFATLALGLACVAVGTRQAILLGGVLVTLGDIVLFLKNDLEALARSSRSDAVVFGQQRLAAGIGAFSSGIVGGLLYAVVENSGHTGLFWIAAAAQSVLLPLLLVPALRSDIRRREQRLRD